MGDSRHVPRYPSEREQAANRLIEAEEVAASHFGDYRGCNWSHETGAHLLAACLFILEDHGPCECHICVMARAGVALAEGEER